MNKKMGHLVILYALVAVGGIISLYFLVSYLATILFFLIIPSVYLTLISKEFVQRSAFFSLSFIGIPLVIDGLLILNNAWYVATIFPFKVLNLIPVEDFLFAFFSIYLIVMLYEYFIEPHPGEKRKDNNLVLVSIVLVASFLCLYFIDPSVLYIPYAYATVFLFSGFAPTVVFLRSRPGSFKNYFRIAAGCFFFSLFYEITALKIGAWSFPGTQYLSMISFWGVRFPFEELFFFLIFLPVGVLAYYEFFTYRKDKKTESSYTS